MKIKQPIYLAFSLCLLITVLLVARSWNSANAQALDGPPAAYCSSTHAGENVVHLPTVLRNYKGGITPLTRLVLFEAFLSTGCGYCQMAGPIIDDQLAPEYADRPVLFLEYDASVWSSRLGRWWGAFGGNEAGYPLVMVDSGAQVFERISGGTDFYNTFKSMVDTALAAPDGLAEIETVVERNGDEVTFTVDVTNRGTVTLSPSNGASVWVLVYEQAESGNVAGRLTSRFVRAQVEEYIYFDLAPGATRQYTLVVDSLSGVDWSKMHAVVLVDYIPNVSGDVYNTYQAIAVEIP